MNIRLSRLQWALVTALSILLVGYLYEWAHFFYDGMYYLSTVSKPDFKAGLPVHDRWFHMQALWVLLKLSSGPSAFSFHLIQTVYRILMILSLVIWWRVWCYVWTEKSAPAFGLFFMLTSPLSLYMPHQVTPDQWALFWAGLGTWNFFRTLNQSRQFWQILSGPIFYLAFLSRSDGLLLPAVLIGVCFCMGYASRRVMMQAILFSLAGFLPLFLWHLSVTGLKQLMPMLVTIWKLNQSGVFVTFKNSLAEIGNGTGWHALLALFALTLWHEKKARILAVTCLILYSIFFFWILQERAMVGRHTVQGALPLIALGTVGFLRLVSIIPLNQKKIAASGLLVLTVYLHVPLANLGTAGLDLPRLKEIAETINQNESSAVLLISDDPGYRFYEFYFPKNKTRNFYLCYAGGTYEQKQEYRKVFKEQWGERYIASIEELKRVAHGKIYYMVNPGWSWLGDETSVSFKEVPALGSYKNFPLMQVYLER